MKRLTVLTPRNDSDALVRRLMKLKCVEINTTVLDEEGELYRNDCDTARAEAEKRVSSIAEAIPVLDKYTVTKSPWRDKPINTSTGLFRKTGSYHAAWAVVDEVLELKATMTECHHEDGRMAARIAMLNPWLNYDLPLETDETRSAYLWLGVFPAAVRISAVQAALEPYNAGVEEVHRDKVGMYAAILLHKEDEETVNRALVGLGFVRNQFKELKGTPKQETRNAERKMDELAEYLYFRETITGEEFMQILNQ